MKNTDLLLRKIDDSLNYLYALDEKLKPILDKLVSIIYDGLTSEELTVKEAFEMWLAIQEQYTNSVMLQTKLKEMMKYQELS